MLDLNFSTKLISEVWDTLPDRSQLPCDREEYYSLSGPTPTSPTTRRQFHRIRARGQAILMHGDKLYGIYTLDVSPNGVGLISPVQLFPGDQADLRSDKCDTLSLQICRCRRLGPKSYVCGSSFLQGPMGPGVYKRFLDQLR